MGKLDFIDNVMEQKLMSLHTCYLAKVISTDGSSAKIQPLGKSKQYGESAIEQSPLSNVPIANSARYKFTKESITYVNDASVSTAAGSFVTGVSGGNVSATGTALTSAVGANAKTTKEMVTVNLLAAGDIVVCVCCERNITESKKGNNDVPVKGHHSMSDSIIIAVL